jgi:hypothetical protein
MKNKEFSHDQESGVQLTFRIEEVLLEAYSFEIEEFTRIAREGLAENTAERVAADARIEESRAIRQILILHKDRNRFSFELAENLAGVRDRLLRLINDKEYLDRTHSTKLSA